MLGFDFAFEKVVGHEGGFQNSKDDRGNWTSGIVGNGELRGTKFGISAMSYPDLDIVNLTLDQCKQLYKRDFWDRAHCDSLHPVIAFQVFDTAVNSGIGQSIRFLQRAIGVADDGVMGPLTMAAIQRRETAELIARFNAERLEFMTKLSTWEHFGKGWARRIASNLKEAT